jgi:hypothetical protein
MQIDATLLPARGDDAVEILENDHQVIKGLLNQLVSASSPQRKSVIEQLVGVLTIHNATEENLVYPALNKVAGSKLESQHLYHETMEADLLQGGAQSLSASTRERRCGAHADAHRFGQAFPQFFTLRRVIRRTVASRGSE